MRYKLLGRTGLRISEACLGTMTFGEDWGWGAAPEECRKMLDLFVERGGNFIDTANNYTGGASERILGELLEGRRERFVLASKYTLSADPSDPNASGNHRKNLVRTVEESLRRLRTDRLDLLWMHAWDELTPAEEVMRALDDAVRSGKVLHVGVSDTPAWVVSRSNAIAELRGWTAFAALQIEYSLIERTVERELLPMARALGLTVTPWGALGGGVLTGKYEKGSPPKDAQRAPMNAGRLTDRAFAVAAEVRQVAGEVGKSPSQVALAWVRQQGPGFVPILGARKVSQLADNLGAFNFELGKEHLARLDAVSRVDLGFPMAFLGQPFIRALVHGDTWEKIDR